MASKTTKQAQVVADFFPWIKLCLIYRLTDEKAVQFLKDEAKLDEISVRTYQRYKAEYNKGSTKRFLEIASSEWANEHVLVIDKIKHIEEKYWEIFTNTPEENIALKSLDSLRALQDQLILIYNETPMIQKVKEALEDKLLKIDEAQKKLEKKKGVKRSKD